ncbi:MAG: leucine-rich repeat domain-containing protein, partial [Lachnospiraceae bacterium]
MRGKTMHKLILSICVGMLLLSEMGTSVQAATSNSLSYFYSTTSEAYAIQGYTPSDNEDLYTDKLVVPNIFQGENQGTTYTGPVVQVNASVFADHKFQYVYFENEYPLVLKEKAFQNVEVKCPENSSDSDDGSIIFCGKVKTVGAYAFNNIKLDGYLDFRGGIDTIGDYAMSNMQIKGLKSDSIRVIGKGAFSNNEITSWYGATGLETVGDNAFEYCTQLTEMSFPDTVTSIGANCFKGCTKLTKVTLPANAELTIGEAAFPDQAGLVVIIPSAITDISNYHFESLVNVVFQVEGDCSTTVIQYFEENSMQYKEGEDGEVIKGSGSSGGGN